MFLDLPRCVQSFAWVFVVSFFFFNDTATTEIYTLSLHDALPIFTPARGLARNDRSEHPCTRREDRKSTRLNSSHVKISYAVFCLKKKKTTNTNPAPTATTQSEAERHQHTQHI